MLIYIQKAPRTDIFGTKSASTKQVAISVAANESVAGAKLSYLRACRAAGHQYQFLEFRFRGELLDDSRPMVSYGMKSGDTIIHVDQGAMGGKPGLSAQHYTDLAAEQAARKTAGAPSPTRVEWQQSGEWAHGDAYKSFPPVPVWSKRQDVEPRFELMESPKLRPWEQARSEAVAAARKAAQQRRHASFGDVKTPGRTLAARYRCRVAGASFNVIHRLEGRWIGDITIGNQQHISNTTLTFVANPAGDRGVWVQETVLTAPGGAAQKSRVRLVPISDGVLRVESMIPPQPRGETTLARECGESVMVFITTSTQSAQVTKIETLTLGGEMTAMHRHRVTQIFTALTASAPQGTTPGSRQEGEQQQQQQPSSEPLTQHQMFSITESRVAGEADTDALVRHASAPSNFSL